MQAAIIIYEPETDFAKRNGPDAPSYWAGWQAYTHALQQAGVMRGGAGLEPPNTAACIRVPSGNRQVQDGPFADTKEQLGGFYLIEVDSMEQAMQWAARCPAAATGTIEVRPLLVMPNES